MIVQVTGSVRYDFSEELTLDDAEAARFLKLQTDADCSGDWEAHDEFIIDRIDRANLNIIEENFDITETVGERDGKQDGLD